MKYSKSFLLQVKRFEDEQEGVPQNDTGLLQFHSYESRGFEPETLDPYFTRLLNGKKWFEWRINQIAKTYGTDDWWGWYQLEQDYKDDPGQVELIRQRIKQQR